MQFDLIDEVSFENGDHSKYELIIMTTASCISDKIAKTIRKYVENGGKIISTFDTGLYDEIKKGNMEEFDIKSGDIVKITTDGSITTDKFKYSSYSSYGKYDWWRYGISSTLDDDTYIADLKTVAAYQGYSPDIIDELLENGFSPEEIEDYIYF